MRGARDKTPLDHKQYKLTEEDWRNRDRWNSYKGAACEMIEKTGTAVAPWVVVEANNKEWARVRVIKSVVQHAAAVLIAPMGWAHCR